MAVKGDQTGAVAHVTQGVALGVDLGPVKAQLVHFFDGAADDALLLAALAGDGDQIPQELGHVGQIVLGGLLDLFKIHGSVLLFDLLNRVYGVFSFGVRAAVQIGVQAVFADAEVFGDLVAALGDEQCSRLV